MFGTLVHYSYCMQDMKIKIPAQTLVKLLVFAFTFPLNVGNGLGMYEVPTIRTILYLVSGYNFFDGRLLQKLFTRLKLLKILLNLRVLFFPIFLFRTIYKLLLYCCKSL